MATPRKSRTPRSRVIVYPAWRKLENKAGDKRRKFWRFKVDPTSQAGRRKGASKPSEFYTRRRDARRGVRRVHGANVEIVYRKFA